MLSQFDSGWVCVITIKLVEGKMDRYIIDYEVTIKGYDVVESRSQHYAEESVRNICKARYGEHAEVHIIKTQSV